MSALKETQKQFDTAAQANAFSLVTKIQWVVQALHGLIGQEYKMIHHQLDNELLCHVGCSICIILVRTSIGMLRKLTQILKRLYLDKEFAVEIEEVRCNPR